MEMRLNGLCEGGKANLGTATPGLSNVKYIVVVGHEGGPQDPPLHVLSRPHTANAFVKAWIVWIDWTEVEALSEGEGLAT